MICLRVSLFMQNRGNCHICSQALADYLSERDTKMSNYQVQMASIIISSLKGVTSYQRRQYRDNRQFPGYHPVFFELDACIKLNNTRIKIKLTWSTRSFNSHCFTIVWILVRLIMEQLKPSVNTTVLVKKFKKICHYFLIQTPLQLQDYSKELRTICFYYIFSHSLS